MTIQDPTLTFQRATAATVRAIAKRKNLPVEFGPEPSSIGNTTKTIPIPPKNLPYQQVCEARGAADSMSLRIRYSDQNFHKHNAPNGKIPKEIYDALEQSRCEALGSICMIGVEANLDASLDKRHKSRGDCKITERNPGHLPIVISMMARERLLGKSPPDSISSLIDLWRPYVRATIFDEFLKYLNNQIEFAFVANKLINTLNLDGESIVDDDSVPSVESDNSGVDSVEEIIDEDDSLTESMSHWSVKSPNDGDTQLSRRTTNKKGDGEPTAEEFQILAGEKPENKVDSTRTHYHPYTTRFDAISHANELCGEAELDNLRSVLDQHIEKSHIPISRLANRLQRHLQATQLRGWDFDIEEGLLNSSRLPRIIINPAHSLSFMKERASSFRDSVVTLLLDNSGSMTGRSIITTAVTADILSRTLERCGVKVEILGFTTRDWKGGESRRKWIDDAAPENPGRLNDIQHIIYKSANSPWRRSRRNMGLMLRQGILKENIDGEALLWAYSRLKHRIEQRKILMVVSDGAPFDDSTLSSNPKNYLDCHLKSVAYNIENSKAVELFAIGIGHDVSQYYSRSVTIRNIERLGITLVGKLTELFCLKTPKFIPDSDI